MPNLRGLRAQILLWTILPLILVLLAVSFGSIALHQRSMRDLVARRDARLVEMAAERLNGELEARWLALQTLVPPSPITASAQGTSAGAGHLPALFDRGTRVFEPGMTPSSEPTSALLSPSVDEAVFAAALARPGAPAIALARTPDGALVALVGLVDPASTRAVMGAVSVGALNLPNLLGQLSGEGQRSIAFLVDDSGEVIYRADGGEVGQNLRDHAGVSQVLEKLSGATFSRSTGTDEHVIGYSPVLLADWGLIIEEPWRDVVVPTLQYTLMAPLVVLAAAVTSLIAVFFVLRRVVRPLHILGLQASQLAWGDFRAIHTQVHGIGEIEELQRILQEMAEQIGRHQASMQDYIAELTRVQEDERRRLARELHDETVQSLIALSQRVAMLELDVGEGASMLSPEIRFHIQQRLADLSSLVAQSQQNVRRLIRDLRPLYLEEAGLVSALEVLAASACRDGLSTDLDVTGEERRLQAEAELAVFRIAQAAISNVTRHARATKVRLGLHFTETGVTLEVEDDGVGFSPPHVPSDLTSQGHFGLVGMRERSTRLGGHLSIRSAPGQGTKVEAFLPYSPTFPATARSLGGKIGDESGRPQPAYDN